MPNKESVSLYETRAASQRQNVELVAADVKVSLLASGSAHHPELRRRYRHVMETKKEFTD